MKTPHSPIELSHPETPLQDGGANRRRGQRQRVLRKGIIVFKDGNCTIGCQILDTSEAGAKLMPTDVFLVPKEFVLKPQDGEPHYCTVTWRKGSYIGVRYSEVERQPGRQDDRRHRGRRRAAERGLIMFNDGRSSMACQIVNVSETGAKLIPADTFRCPREFMLQKQHSGRRRCIVVWRRGLEIGVRYV